MRSCAAELVLLSLCSVAFAAEPLAPHGADGSKFTVSGVSSGGTMAVQLHVAHSSRVSGVGALAAGPYYCAKGSLWNALVNCMSPGQYTGPPATFDLRAQAERFASEGLIDPTGNLAKARVWLFSGTQDRTVTPRVVSELGGFYVLYNVRAAMVSKPAGHGMVTDNAGVPCGATEPPYINDCDYDAAGELLQHLLGNLSPPAAKPDGRLLAFNQNDFVKANSVSMADDGYAYIPRACDTARCRVHVAFHGCRQGAEAVGEHFVRDAGYNRWADTNRLIVLYPQAIARYWGVYNPRGCWDWWGYTGSRYATKDGAQIRAVIGMVDRLSEARK